METFLAFLAAFAVLALMVWRSNQEWAARPVMHCLHYHTEAQAVPAGSSRGALQFAGVICLVAGFWAWFLWVVAAACFAFARSMPKQVCPSCGGKDLVPQDSPAAQRWREGGA